MIVSDVQFPTNVKLIVFIVFIVSGPSASHDLWDHGPLAS